MKNKWKLIFTSLSLIILVLLGLFYWYINDNYQSFDEAIAGLQSDAVIEVSGKNPIQFKPKNKEVLETGIIFYPGGKVEEESYSLLLRGISERGYVVFMVDMPFGLAVFDIDAAEEIMEENPNITEWYLAGHSLGGAMAAVFAADQIDELAGLVLLGAYSSVDLSQTDLPVLSIYGSEDQIIDKDKIIEYREMLPEGYLEVVVEGGNHAQFGNYGPQVGDGKASISRKEQQRITVDEIDFFIKVIEKNKTY